MNEFAIRSVNAGKISIDKIMQSNTDKSCSYVRGYLWRNYRIRIKSPLDEAILYMIHDALIERRKQLDV